ncbi:chaperone modulator CbpM [Acuticoccus sp. M5D2P5]|uniref:chaperone modulator CbpM n=1 Tax=Acuticoccus kalidii TaxID=2910977 RepID=UPI001F4692D9|nr:chaperone modulator CbpM [Acuticoccus kalidii]MCF3934610.1 chaperone modulator CbpM [Acuticoccus kalidii]
MMRWTETEIVAEVRTITLQRLRVMVSHGWVTPATGANGPTFDSLDVARVRLLSQLGEDMEVADEAMPMVLSLIDQVYGLRRELKALGGAIETQPEKVKADIRAAYHARRED